MNGLVVQFAKDIGLIGISVKERGRSVDKDLVRPTRATVLPGIIILAVSLFYSVVLVADRVKNMID